MAVQVECTEKFVALQWNLMKFLHDHDSNHGIFHDIFLIMTRIMTGGLTGDLGYGAPRLLQAPMNFLTSGETSTVRNVRNPSFHQNCCF